MTTTLLQESQALQNQLQRHRHWLHQHPGTGFDLQPTREYVRQELIGMGYSPVDCGRMGLYADLQGGQPGKTLLLRADMDALPIREEASVPFASQNGCMHACGHDLHTAMLLGAAQLLMTHRQQLHGNIRFMFQPAEEILEGAKDMIDSGVLDTVDAGMMIHVTPAVQLSPGTVVVSKPGISAPSATYFSIHVQGKGCHGAAPHQGVDALSVAAHILIALQQLHARELPSDSGAVLTIGAFHGGSVGNVISGEAVLQGTIRSVSPEITDFLRQRLEDISLGIAHTFRASANVEYSGGCPALKNAPELCAVAIRSLTDLLGSQNVIDATHLPKGSGGGSEDFAYVSQAIPTLMLALAAGTPQEGYKYPLHHPKVTFDENVLSTGTAVFAQFAIRYLSEDVQAPQQTP